MTAVSVSTRSDQATSSVPESIQEKSLTTTSLAFSGPKPILTKTKIDRAAAISRAAQVTICAGRSPITRQNRPGDRGGKQRQQDDELDGEIHGASRP